MIKQLELMRTARARSQNHLQVCISVLIIVFEGESCGFV
jgi:hypothetical protein